MYFSLYICIKTIWGRTLLKYKVDKLSQCNNLVHKALKLNIKLRMVLSP